MKLIKSIAWIVLIIFALIAAYLIFFAPPSDEGKKQTIQEEEREDIAQGKPALKERGQEIAPPVHETPPSGGLPPVTETKIAIIIDDVGFDLSPVRELLAIDAPIAFAVLPDVPHSVAAAEILSKAGRDILLHLPMEPQNPGQDPGPGALFRRMGEAEIRQQVDEDIADVPHAIGVNNHMGSAFMEDEEKLAVVLRELKKKGLFFIDSRTTPHSKAGELAAKMGIAFAMRKVFIDNGQDREITVRNMLGHLEDNGNHRIIMIGHPYRSTILALREAVPLLKARGAVIVPPTELLNTTGKTYGKR